MSAILNLNASINDITSGVVLSANKTVTAAGTALDLRILEIGTSEEEVTIAAEIGDAGVAFVQNLSAANFVEVGFETGVYPVKLLAGQFALIPLAPETSSLFLKANTSACDVKLYVHEA